MFCYGSTKFALERVARPERDHPLAEAKLVQVVLVESPPAVGLGA